VHEPTCKVGLVRAEGLYVQQEVVCSPEFLHTALPRLPARHGARYAGSRRARDWGGHRVRERQRMQEGLLEVWGRGSAREGGSEKEGGAGGGEEWREREKAREKEKEKEREG
jgi:hypothetical protein